MKLMILTDFSYLQSVQSRCMCECAMEMVCSLTSSGLESLPSTMRAGVRASLACPRPDTQAAVLTATQLQEWSGGRLVRVATLPGLPPGPAQLATLQPPGQHWWYAVKAGQKVRYDKE